MRMGMRGIGVDEASRAPLGETLAEPSANELPNGGGGDRALKGKQGSKMRAAFSAPAKTGLLPLLACPGVAGEIGAQLGVALSFHDLLRHVLGQQRGFSLAHRSGPADVAYVCRGGARCSFLKPEEGGHR